MSTVTSPEPGKWEITTPKGRKIVVEAPYITETEARILASIVDRIEDKVEELLQEYELEITIDIRSGRGVARWRKKQS